MIKILRKLIGNNFYLFLLLLNVKIVNMYFTRTIFEPDETWQNLDPINYLLYRHGEPTWDWMLGIRSPVGLVYFIPSYLFFLITKTLKIQYSFFVSFMLPRILSAILSSISSLYLVKLGDLLKKKRENVVMTIILSHTFWMYSTRLHTDTLIMNLGIIIFYNLYKFYQEVKILPKSQRKLAPSTFIIFLISFIFYLRPQSIILFISIILMTFYEFYRKRIFDSILFALYSGSQACGFIFCFILIDSIFAERLWSCSLQFININVFKGVADLFGTHPFYFSFLFFLILMGLKIFPFLLYLKDNLTLALVVLPYLSVYTCLGHKEMRFLLPIIPYSLLMSSKKIPKHSDHRNSYPAYKAFLKYLKILAYFLQMAIGFYMSLFHQRYEPIMNYIQSNTSSEDSISFLICPYTLPIFPYLPNHKNIEFLSTNPDIYKKIDKLTILKKYKDIEFVSHKYEKFAKDLPRSLKQYLNSDYIVINRNVYLKHKDEFHGYEHVKDYRYCHFIFGEELKDYYFTLLKKITTR